MSIQGIVPSSTPYIARNINRVAASAITLLALSNIPGAEAGPVLYGVCVSACMAIVTPVFMPACIAGCLVAGTAPTP